MKLGMSEAAAGRERDIFFRDIRARALDDAEAIVTNLLGEMPNKKLSDGRSCAGQQGRLRAGHARAEARPLGDHSIDRQLHDPADLVIREKGGDQKSAFKWLTEWFGGAVPPVDHEALRKKAEQENRAWEKERALKLEEARAFWQHPPAGTPGQIYLEQRLGLALPDSVLEAGQLAWHPAPWSQTLQ